MARVPCCHAEVCVEMAGLTCAHWWLHVQQVCSLAQSPSESTRCWLIKPANTHTHPHLERKDTATSSILHPIVLQCIVLYVFLCFRVARPSEHGLSEHHWA
jgi:hypothetical protein